MARGRARQEAYERALRRTAEVLLCAPLTVRELVDLLRGTPAACNKAAAYARIAELEERGYVVWKTRREGGSTTGPAPLVFSVEGDVA